MSKDKTEKFIESLIDKSENDQVDWKSEGRGDFTFSTQKASVRITQLEELDTERRVTSLYVFNKTGNLVDFSQVNVALFSPENSPLELLHNKARRTAYNADSILDSIIHDIDNPPEDEDNN